MNIFDTHKQTVEDYAQYILSFTDNSDTDDRADGRRLASEGRLWPQPLLQFNPRLRTGWDRRRIIAAGLLHDDARHIFDGYSTVSPSTRGNLQLACGTDFVVDFGDRFGQVTDLHRHNLQSPARQSGGRGVAAVIVYPMNALINSADQRIHHLQGQLREEHSARFSHHLRTVHQPGKGGAA